MNLFEINTCTHAVTHTHNNIMYRYAWLYVNTRQLLVSYIESWSCVGHCLLNNVECTSYKLKANQWCHESYYACCVDGEKDCLWMSEHTNKWPSSINATFHQIKASPSIQTNQVCCRDVQILGSLWGQNAYVPSTQTLPETPNSTETTCCICAEHVGSASAETKQESHV